MSCYLDSACNQCVTINRIEDRQLMTLINGNYVFMKIPWKDTQSKLISIPTLIILLFSFDSARLHLKVDVPTSQKRNYSLKEVRWYIGRGAALEVLGSIGSGQNCIPGFFCSEILSDIPEFGSTWFFTAFLVEVEYYSEILCITCPYGIRSLCRYVTLSSR